MSSDAIEEERSHLEDTLILSPSMPTLDIEYEPISKPIFDHYGLFYALYLNLMMILEIHLDIPCIGIIKTI